MQAYIHIPFCDSKCHYCRFASIKENSQIKKDFYFKFLLQEIKQSPVSIETGLKTIYFWGWTPSSFSPEKIKYIIKDLENKFSFDNDIEISLETTPSKLNIENLELWEKIWINRLSMWIQTLNNKSLKEINRDNRKDVINALESIKAYFKKNEKTSLNISVDFIIWLPHTKKWETKKDIEFVLEKYDFISHISVYMLEDYYYPEWWEEKSIKEDDFLEEYKQVENFLKSKLFDRYEISNFAKSWKKSRHNKWYWDHNEYIWFWLSAHSFLKNWDKYIRYANSDKFIDYYKSKLLYKEVLSDEDLFLEKIMSDLRTNWIKEKYLNKLDKNKINDFIKNWYISKSNDFIKLENKWILVLDYILKEIIK